MWIRARTYHVNKLRTGDICIYGIGLSQRSDDCSGAPPARTRCQSRGFVGIASTMDNQSNAHGARGREGPHRNGDDSREHSIRRGGDPGFADRLKLNGSLSPSIVRYPGPRDYCGFEAPSQVHFEEPPLGGSLDPLQCEPRGPRRTVNGDLDDPRRTDAGSSHGEPSRRPLDNRGGRVTSNSGADRDEASGHQPSLTPRLKRPGVPGYEILEELGRGGMGVVYKARQLRLNRLVALKMILAGEYAGTDAVERFLAEAQIVARLRHPNIVQIHAIGDCEGRPYVELEYVEGGSLGLRLDGTPWPPRAAARLVESLASALAEAHRTGIVHRDLKPANILMTDDGTPKITDFGLAKSSEKDLGLTKTDSILGSPSYMAPEQAEGQAKDVGPEADIYALGANLYELLTGRPPFVGPTVLATLDLVKNAEPVPPRRLQPGLAADLETICPKCLRKEPQRRYESADALAEDLDRYLNGEPILARPTPRWERVWKWVRRRPSSAALIVVSTISIVAAAGGGLWYRAERDRQRAAVRRRVDGVREQASRFILLGEEAIRRKDWDGARAQTSSALALIRTEPDLLAMSTPRLADAGPVRRQDRRAERPELRPGRGWRPSGALTTRRCFTSPSTRAWSRRPTSGRAGTRRGRPSISSSRKAARDTGSPSLPTHSTRRRWRLSPNAITSWRSSWPMRPRSRCRAKTRWRRRARRCGSSTGSSESGRRPRSSSTAAPTTSYGPVTGRGPRPCGPRRAPPREPSIPRSTTSWRVRPPTAGATTRRPSRRSGAS